MRFLIKTHAFVCRTITEGTGAKQNTTKTTTSENEYRCVVRIALGIEVYPLKFTGEGPIKKQKIKQQRQNIAV